jgi:hypothetical protein
MLTAHIGLYPTWIDHHTQNGTEPDQAVRRLTT